MLIISVQTSALTKSCRYNNGRKSWYDRECHICSSGSAIGLAGSAVIIAFMMNAMNTFTTMICAELGSSTPDAEGSFLVREGLPRPNAFVSSWMAWFAHIAAGSLL